MSHFIFQSGPVANTTTAAVDCFGTSFQPHSFITQASLCPPATTLDDDIFIQPLNPLVTHQLKLSRALSPPPSPLSFCPSNPTSTFFC